VLFLDDDVICRPGWLESLMGAWRGGAHIMGGPIVLIWPGTRPAWATSSASSLWAAFDLGETPLDLQGHQALVAASMAVDRDHALQLGGFNERLGHGAGTALMGEETEFCMRALKVGLRLRYEPDAVVEHCLQPEEVTRRRFLCRMYRFGRTMTLLQPPAAVAFPVLRRVAKASLIAFSAPFTGQPTAKLGEAAFLLGVASILQSPGRHL
jgi:GT2 family glycosyltransferase